MKWSDGICSYDSVAPTEAFFVPVNVFQLNKKFGYDVPLEQVLAVSTRMTVEELKQFTDRKGTESNRYLLFVFPNQRRNSVFWQGKNTDRWTMLRVWDGKFWSGKSSGRSIPDNEAYIFFRDEEQKNCYVMICEEHRESFVTTQISFGRFPDAKEFFESAINTSDSVVNFPYSLKREFCTHSIDFVKGYLTEAELLRSIGDTHISDGTIVFLSKTDTGYKVNFMYSYRNNILAGPFGDNSITKYEGFSMPQEAMRWQLAKMAASAANLTDDACLLTARPESPDSDWLTIELTVSEDNGPGILCSPSVSASKRDGGAPYYSFKLQKDGREIELPPPRRSPRTPTASEEKKPVSANSQADDKSSIGIYLQKVDEFDCEYGFVSCGAGVLKLILHSLKRPWTARIQASYQSRHMFFGESPAEPPKVYQSNFVNLIVK